MPRKKKPTHRSFESMNDHGRFIKLTVSMMESEAWKQLTVYEQALYLHIKAKYRGIGRNGTDNSRDLSFTYQEGTRLMSRYRFTRAIDALIEVGLIDIVRHLPQAREATIYGLSDRWHHYGTADFKQQKRGSLKRRKVEINV
jgi:hypothetical protein